MLYSNVMDDLYKILRGLLSITVPPCFASTMKDIVSTSFELFSAVREKRDDYSVEDDELETGKHSVFCCTRT